MKKLILYFIILLLAVWVGVFVSKYPGYLYIHIANTRIETTFWMAVLVVLVVFLALHTLLKLVQGLLNLPERLHTMGQRRAVLQGFELTTRGLSELIIHDYRQAESHFLKAAGKSVDPFQAYLGAAQAAQAQKDYTQRNVYLNRAAEHANAKQNLPLAILAARWQQQSGEYPEALRTLDQIAPDYPTHPAVLTAYQRIYQDQSNWAELLRLLPKLHKAKVLPPSAWQALAKQVYVGLFTQTNHEYPMPELWKNMPDVLHQDPELLALYAHYLIQQGDYDQAEKRLKQGLDQELNPLLLAQYADVVSSQPSKQLSQAESWLKQGVSDPDLLICLGKLCIRHRLWGKARSYLEKSIQYQPAPLAYQLLGTVLEQLGEKTAALQCYRSGLQLLT